MGIYRYNADSESYGSLSSRLEREPWRRAVLGWSGTGMSISFSLSRYLAVGIPVIVPVEISHQVMIEGNHLGLVVNTLEEAASAVEVMTEGEYREYTKAVEQFAPSLWNGYYVKKALIETMRTFYRKDAGRLPDLWYSRKPGGHTRDIHQHYLLLKGQEKEKGFLVKAYVETLNGKLVLEKSRPVYLEKKQYGSHKVSMVIPAYNAENYIARCIDTVLAQSQPDVEIIVVDDGSADHAPEIIDWYADHYENVIVRHQENGGVAVARNTGMKSARGEYIGFMDNDDMVYPSMVERLYQSAKKNDCDIAVTSVYMVTDTEYIKYVVIRWKKMYQ